MNFQPLKIPGLLVSIPEIHQDERGRFHRSFCENELAKSGIHFQVKQGNLSDNLRMHTLRGFHYQQVPTQEAKLLACVTGAIYNVVLDLRRKSKTYQQWEGIEISAEKRQTIHVPAGCANAFLTLEDNTIVHYYMSEFFVPETYQGIRYNDPFFRVEWPFEPKVISDRDATFPDYRPD